MLDALASSLTRVKARLSEVLYDEAERGGTGVKKEALMLANLNCPSCAAGLQRALAGLPGVRRAEVAFASGILELEYDESAVGSGEVERVLSGFGVSIAARL